MHSLKLISRIRVQAVDSMLILVRALAQQWFGAWLRPKAPSDEWLLQGLCAHFTNLFIGKYLGRNEILYRCRPDQPHTLGSGLTEKFVHPKGACGTRKMLNNIEHAESSALSRRSVHAEEDMMCHPPMTRMHLCGLTPRSCSGCS